MDPMTGTCSFMNNIDALTYKSRTEKFLVTSFHHTPLDTTFLLTNVTKIKFIARKLKTKSWWLRFCWQVFVISHGSHKMKVYGWWENLFCTFNPARDSLEISHRRQSFVGARFRECKSRLTFIASLDRRADELIHKRLYEWKQILISIIFNGLPVSEARSQKVVVNDGRNRSPRCLSPFKFMLTSFPRNPVPFTGADD